MSEAITIEEEAARLQELTASYDHSPFDIKMRDYMMRTFQPFFRDGKCLQVGCAHGDQTTLLCERFGDVTVVEPADEFIRYTQSRVGDRARFVRAMIEDWDTADRFDTILFSHVLEHVIDPVLVLRKLSSLLTPNGRLFVVVPNGYAASRQIAVKMGVLSHLGDLSIADVNAGHRRVYMLDTLVRDVRAAGMKAVQTGGIFFKPLANFQFNALMGGPLIGDDFMEACFELGREHPSLSASIYAVAEAAGA